MQHIPLTMGLLLLCSLNAGCTGQAPTQTQKLENSRQTLCTTQRPELCTQQWNPVCAILTDGSRKTYASGCTACADKSVEGWRAGECAARL